MIRGKGVDEALAILRYLPHRAARMIEKVVKSAQANAADRGMTELDKLIVKKAWVDEGLMMKRFRPRARGGAAPLLKRRSHICIELDVA